MLIYGAILLIPIYVYMVSKYVRKRKKILMLIPFFYLLIFAGLRNGQMGADYKNYISIFNYYNYTGRMSYGIGWRIVNRIALFFSDDYHILGLVTTFLILMLVFCIIMKKVDYKQWYLCFLIYLFNPYLYLQANFNIMRQGMAMALIFLGFVFLEKSKNIQFIVCVLVASTIHGSAIIMLVLLLIKAKQLEKRMLQIIAVVSFLIGFFVANDTVVTYFASFFGYAGYSGYGDTLFNFPLYKIFVFVIMIFLCQYYDIAFKSEKDRLYARIYIISLAFMEMVLVNDIAYRIYLYFAILHVLILPHILICLSHATRDRYLRLIYKWGTHIYYIVYFVAFIIQMQATNNVYYVPYIFYK